ncbi:hypothetical protein CRENBAI_020393 [Crenichthys baileyi]|uniref:Sushi domain-containing protein n=1 Tax=Crenichthys baileyi TaxID=28760 RepID=A0AAV9SHA7_9TELE
MDSDRLSIFICVTMVCRLAGTTPQSSAGNCTCPKIPEMKFTLPEERCFQINDRYRYQCIEGYVRKAGTSNLIKCEKKSGVLQWTISHLTCISDPKFPPQPPNSTGVTTQAPNQQGTSVSLQSVRTFTSEATISHNMEQSTSGTGNTTTVQPSTIQSSTHSPNNHNNKNFSFSDSFTEADTKTIGICSFVVILLFAVSGVIFLLYRRRNRPIVTQEAEEMEPMKNSV